MPAASPIALRRLVAVLGLADRRRGDDPDRLGAELLGEPHLGRDDLGDLGDLLVGDPPLALRVLLEARVGALLHHLAQLPSSGSATSTRVVFEPISIAAQSTRVDDRRSRG